jgi:hypothetical protein
MLLDTLEQWFNSPRSSQTPLHFGQTSIRIPVFDTSSINGCKRQFFIEKYTSFSCFYLLAYSLYLHVFQPSNPLADGWVGAEKPGHGSPDSGFTIKRCDGAGSAALVCALQRSLISGARWTGLRNRRLCALRIVRLVFARAGYSLWMSMAADWRDIGHKNGPTKLPPPHHRRAPDPGWPPLDDIAIIVIAPANAAATVPTRTSRFFMWASSWASTPSCRCGLLFSEPFSYSYSGMLRVSPGGKCVRRRRRSDIRRGMGKTGPSVSLCIMLYNSGA